MKRRIISLACALALMLAGAFALAEAPEEIAVSIAAELIAVRAAKRKEAGL